jgi:AbrB family looped-hinge helix DNA binding protein
MQTKLSTKGQIVLPSSIRQKLGLQAGDRLEAEIQGDRVTLTPRRKRARKPRIVADRLTKLPVLSAGPDAPPLTSDQVHAIFDEFP